MLEIQTTQNIKLEYETASIGERMLAAIIDRIVFILWVLLWVYVIEVLYLNFSLVWGIIMFAPVIFYYLFCELWFNGKSIGKHIMSIRVAKTDGSVPSLGDYLLRWMFRLVDNSTVAIVCMMCTPRSQRLGDLAAKTSVIRTKSTARLIRIPKADPDYRVTFDTATLLSDKDVSIIMQILSNHVTLQNKTGIHKLALKVKNITQTQSDLPDYKYLKTIIADYNYLAGKL